MGGKKSVKMLFAIHKKVFILRFSLKIDESVIKNSNRVFKTGKVVWIKNTHLKVLGRRSGLRKGCYKVSLFGSDLCTFRKDPA